MSKSEVADSSTDGASEWLCNSACWDAERSSVFRMSMNDASSTTDDSTIVAQELLGRRSRLADEGLLSPRAGGLEWSPRLLSDGWIAVGDEIWLDIVFLGLLATPLRV